jgi:hypothetical protein
MIQKCAASVSNCSQSALQLIHDYQVPGLYDRWHDRMRTAFGPKVLQGTFERDCSATKSSRGCSTQAWFSCSVDHCCYTCDHTDGACRGRGREASGAGCLHASAGRYTRSALRATRRVSTSRRRSPLALLAAAALTALACSPLWTEPATTATHTGTARVCLVLPSERLSEARAAVEAWNHSLERWRNLTAVTAEPCDYIVRETEEEHWSGYGSALAWASKLGGREISLRRGHYEQDVKGLLLHELGHALGAQHVEGTLMHPQWSRGAFRCPDKVTVVQVAAWNRVNISLLRWCYQ